MVLLLLLILLRKRNTKHPQHIPIGGLDITTRLDDGLTLLDETADLSRVMSMPWKLRRQ